MVWSAAREYAKNGIYVFPLYVSRKADGKKDVRPLGLWRSISSTSLADIGAWEQQYPDAGLGIDCGKSGLVVIDPDGEEGVQNWEALNPEAPFWIVGTPGGGQHWFYAAAPDHVIGNDQDGKVAPSVDVRGLGGFVIAAPTSDGTGSWETNAGGPWWLQHGETPCIVPAVVIERMRATRPRESAPTATSGVPDDLFEPATDTRTFTEAEATTWIENAEKKLKAAEAGLNGAINDFAMVCAHFPWLVDREKCAALVQRHLGERQGWPAPDRDDLATINSAYSATEAGRSWVALQVEPAQVTPDDDEPEDRWTDAMLSGRLAREELAQVAVFTSALGWLQWDRVRWAPVADEVMHEIGRRWVLRMYAGAVAAYRAIPAPDHKLSEDPAVKGWAGAQSANRIASIVKLARGQVMRDAGDFDRDPDVLNCPNGVVDLRTGEVMKHDPDRLITKVTGADYVPGAFSPALKAALEAVPADSRDWLQRRLGEAATGHSGEQLVLLSGTGRNGKTLLMGATFRALGDYSAKVPNTLLLRARQAGGATPERMTLRGVRLAYMEETPEDGYLDATVVKDLLDAEEIEGRHLYKDIVSWRPTHSLFLNTNHPPTMGDTGDAAWRRLTRLDFPLRYRKADEAIESDRDRRGDPDLKAALGQSKEGQEALLAWVVAGARDYYANGAEEAPPPSVVAGVRTWREESDDLLRFISQEMVWNRDGWVTRSDMYEAFASWLRAGGQKPLSVKTFGLRMGSHSLLSQRVDARQVQKSQPGLTRPSQYLVDGLRRPLPEGRVWAYLGLSFGIAETAPEQEE